MRCTNEENQAIKDLKRLEEVIKNNIPNNKNIKAIKIVLNLLEKKDKVINKMIKAIFEEYQSYEPCPLENKTDCKSLSCKECIKQYFYKKAEEK